jgi:hypothetical protein
MSDEMKDVNLELLAGMKRHLDEAERLRKVFDRLLALAKGEMPPRDNSNTKRKGGADAK